MPDSDSVGLRWGHSIFNKFPSGVDEAEAVQGPQSGLEYLCDWQFICAGPLIPRSSLPSMYPLTHLLIQSEDSSCLSLVEVCVYQGSCAGSSAFSVMMGEVEHLKEEGGEGITPSGWGWGSVGSVAACCTGSPGFNPHAT